MSTSRRGKKHSDAHRKAISQAHLGKVRPKTQRGVCVCGTRIVSGASNAKFCSTQCKRASYGHGIVHSPEFAAFKRECAICTTEKQLVGDHDHVTGKPRGILCRNCNLAIGNLFDSPTLLRKAAQYLEVSCAYI